MGELKEKVYSTIYQNVGKGLTRTTIRGKLTADQYNIYDELFQSFLDNKIIVIIGHNYVNKGENYDLLDSFDKLLKYRSANANKNPIINVIPASPKIWTSSNFAFWVTVGIVAAAIVTILTLMFGDKLKAYFN